MPAADTTAQRIGEIVLAGRAPSDVELRTLVERCCSGDPETARLASVSLFRDVVEPLADSFDPALVEVYVELFARVIDFVRRLPAGAKVDERLRRLGLLGARSLVERWRRVSAAPAATPDDPRAVVVLSRVTLGADVAVTSVFLDAARRRWPDAEILLAAGPKAAGLFAGEPAIQLLETPYPRGGALLHRLAAWLELADLVERKAIDGRAVVIDPDSRLTQLGLLPVAPDSAPYCFFPSRSAESDSDAPLSAIAGRWSACIAPGARPFVALSDEDLERGLQARNERPLATVSWGCGGNERKRVGTEFEVEAVKLLLAKGYRVVLDRGVGAAEYAAAQAALDGAAGADISAWQGSLHGFAGHIAAADLYVGYDSAAGHLAAALGVRGIDVFKGAATPRMLARWSPWGVRPAGVLAVDANESPQRTFERFEALL